MEVSEMNGLELEFLFALRFRLNVTPDDFAAYCATLEGQMSTPTPPLSPTVLMALSPEGGAAGRSCRRRGAAAEGRSWAAEAGRGGGGGGRSGRGREELRRRSAWA